MAYADGESPALPQSRRRHRFDYAVSYMLGQGAFGTVWMVHPTTYPTDPFLALKVARGRPENDSLISKEWEIGQWFNKTHSRDQCPTLFYAAKSRLGGRPCILMEEGLGDAGSYLDAIQSNPPERSLVSHICELAPHLICLLQRFHDAGYVHRDVKLSNFMVMESSNTDQYTFKISDLGLATRYLDEDGYHIPSGRATFVGTPAFSSKNADKGFVQSRRDDMESLAYSLVYAAAPSSFPWRRKSHDQMQQMKAKTSSVVLCRGLPPAFAEFLDYCSQMRFEEQPDYERWATKFAMMAEETYQWKTQETFTSSTEYARPPVTVTSTSPSKHGRPSSRMIPHFAKPTLSQLAKQKPSIRRDTCLPLMKQGPRPPTSRERGASLDF